MSTSNHMSEMESSATPKGIQVTEVRSDGSGNVWGLVSTDDDMAYVQGSGGKRAVTLAHWADMRVVAPDMHHLYPQATETGVVAAGDHFEQIRPPFRRLVVEGILDDERASVRHTTGARQSFPISTLLNPDFFLRGRS